MDKSCKSYGENFKIYNLCYQSYPCKHYVQIDEKNPKMMGGVAIYEYCLLNNIPIPPHFSHYKYNYDERLYGNMIINNDFDNFIGNYLIEKSNKFLIIACSQNNDKFITYLLNDCKVPVTNNVLMSCIHNTALFKMMHDKCREILTFEFLTAAVECKNLDVLKFLIEDKNLEITDARPLIYAINNGLNTIKNYLTEKSNIIYKGHDAIFLKKHVDNNLLFCGPTVTTNSIFDVENETSIYYKELSDNYYEYLKYTDLKNVSELKIPLNIKDFFIKSIIIKTDSKNIDKVQISCNDSYYNFICDDNEYKFICKEPINFKYLVYSDNHIKIISKTNTTLNINNLNIQFFFMNNKEYTHEYHEFIIDKYTKFIDASSGFGMFEKILA